MSKLETAIDAIVKVFEEYTGTDEYKRQLSNAELKALINKELSSPEFQSKIDQDAIKEALEKIDKNQDGQVNFSEFSQYVSLLAKGYFKKKHSKGPR